MIKFAIVKSMAAVLILGVLATGCGETAKKSDADESQNLIIYTGRDKDEVAQVVDLFVQKNPKYKGKVDTLTLGAQAALERLKAEKANPQAGFLWGGTQQGLEQAASEGLLAPSSPANANLIDPARRDSQGRWFAEMLLPEVIVYNHDLLKPEQAPKDWDDLITPAFKGKIVIRDVMPSGTMRTIYSAMMYRQSAASGSPDAGYAWLKKLDANTVSYTPSPDDMYFNIDRGVGTVTLWNLQDALIQPLKNNRPWSYVIPSSGVPVLLDGVGVVNNPKAMQAAVDFENFLLEPKLQLQLAKDYYQIPAMQLPESEKPEWLAKLNIKEMKIDWDAMSAKQNEWMNYWAQNIKGKGGKVIVLTLQAVTKTFKRAGTVVDAVNLQIEEGEFFTLLGPSGCGKSTILRMIAGLESPDSGRILFRDRDITLEPPNKRGIGLVFQNYALFPHLSVAQNVGFGLEVRKAPSAEVHERTTAALKQVQLDSLGAARVDQLSGGQQQRVALARALVIHPTLLLLDEPLSNLDAKLRGETRAMLREVHSSSAVTTIYVTHDQEEALGMSDRIAVLNSGNVHQVATPREIYERPATKFVADFIGRNNVVDAVVASGSSESVVLRLANGTNIQIHPNQRAAGVDVNPGSRVGVCVRAESLRFATEGGICSGVLRDVEYSGSGFSCMVHTDIGDLKMVIPGSVELPGLGNPVRLAVTESALHLVKMS